MTFDWGAAWSVMGIIGIALLAVVMIFVALFVAISADEKWGVHSGVVFVLVLLLMVVVTAGFVGGAA